jgi:hypothetical protein
MFSLWVLLEGMSQKAMLQEMSGERESLKGCLL